MFWIIILYMNSKNSNAKIDENQPFKYLNPEDYFSDKNPLYPYLATFKTRIYIYIIDMVTISIIMMILLLSSENLLFVLFPLLYFILGEYFFGKTLGKLITKTSVYSKDGKLPTLSQIIIRTFCRLIPFDWLFISNIRKPQVLHDKLSGTVVVLDEKIN